MFPKPSDLTDPPFKQCNKGSFYNILRIKSTVKQSVCSQTKPSSSHSLKLTLKAYKKSSKIRYKVKQFEIPEEPVCIPVQKKGEKSAITKPSSNRYKVKQFKTSSKPFVEPVIASIKKSSPNRYKVKQFKTSAKPVVEPVTIQIQKGEITKPKQIKRKNTEKTAAEIKKDFEKVLPVTKAETYVPKAVPPVPKAVPPLTVKNQAKKNQAKKTNSRKVASKAPKDLEYTFTIKGTVQIKSRAANGAKVELFMEKKKIKEAEIMCAGTFQLVIKGNNLTDLNKTYTITASLKNYTTVEKKLILKNQQEKVINVDFNLESQSTRSRTAKFLPESSKIPNLEDYVAMGFDKEKVSYALKKFDGKMDKILQYISQ